MNLVILPFFFINTDYFFCFYWNLINISVVFLECEVMGKLADLSPRKKALIECLLKEKHYSQREIAYKLEVSHKSVSCINISIKSGDILTSKQEGNCGRKPKMSPQMERILVKMAKSNRRATSKDMSDNLKAYGVEVSQSVVWRRLCAAGLLAHRPRQKAKITPAMAKKRLIWAKEVQEKFGNDWSKVSCQFLVI